MPHLQELDWHVMTKHFETKMTTAAGFISNRSNDLDGIANDVESYDVPQPEGVGWQLKQIIPVHNNARFLQFFWERELDMSDSENNENGLFTEPTVNLTI